MTKGQRNMTDYKLVPVEPTPEMIEAAEEAHMPFGDMELALRMAILAARDVQGEKPRRYPIGPLTHEKVFEAAGLTNLSDMQAVLDAVEAALSAPAAPAVQGEPVYLYRRLGLNDFVTCDFTRYTELSGKPGFFETKILYTAPQPAEQQPCVSRLLDALDDIAKLPIDPCSTENDYRLSAAKAIANAALAAYREGGEK